MKSFLVIAILSITVTGTAAGQTKEHGGSTPDETVIQQTMQEVSHALAANDVDKLERLYADDFTFISPKGLLLERSESLGSLRNGSVRFDSFTLQDLRVRVYGNSAVVTAKATVKMKNDGVEISITSRNTMILVKSNGSWKLAATQATPITEH